MAEAAPMHKMDRGIKKKKRNKLGLSCAKLMFSLAIQTSLTQFVFLQISLIVFLWDCLPVKSSFKFISRGGCFPARLYSYVIIFLWGHLPVRRLPVFLFGCLPVRLSSCQVVFFWGCLPGRSSSCQIKLFSFPIECLLLWGGWCF